VLAACVAAAACGDSTAPEPTSYSVAIDVHGFWVIGDCEATAGNDGEFVWQIVANNPTNRRASQSYATANFPAADGQVEVGEGAYLQARQTFNLTDIAPDDRNSATLSFLMTEHDPGGPDPNMDLRRQEGALLFALDEEQQGVVVIGSATACQVSWDYDYTWSGS
jgi:hypothetical protein